MEIIQKGKNVLVNDVRDFNIKQTLECGQCFHFDEISEMEYGLVYRESILHIKQTDNQLLCYDMKKEEFESIWADVLDLNNDYSNIKELLLKEDKKLEEAIGQMYGVRIMNQDFDEMLMSFIISQNKQIPHIKKIVKEISRKYGKKLGVINDIEFYSFPDRTTLKSISVDEFKEIKTGFRAPYLYDASQKLQTNNFDKDELMTMSYEKAKDRLKEIKGVGDKIANCVLLFSLGYRNSFPVDVWIKRIMENMYFDGNASNEQIMDFAKERFGNLGGYAQQYLFYYGRETKIGKNEITSKIEKNKVNKRKQK